MRHWAAILLIAAITLTAGATVRVFVTDATGGYGLTRPQNMFTPSFSSVDALGNNTNAYDYYNGDFAVGAYPPIDSPSGTLAQPHLVFGFHPVHIWFQFQDEPSGAKVDALTITISQYGYPLSDVTTCYYVQNDMGGNVAKKRWDGQVTQPWVPEFKHNPQTLVANTANGIVNGDTDPAMMFLRQSSGANRTGVALLGAASPPNGYWFGWYSIAITEISYANGPDPTIGAPAYFGDIPEPTTLLLLAVCGALIRRR
jgi:hypothetical protein